MDVKIGIADALSLIPEFSGNESTFLEKKIKFVYFKEGCKSALRILDNNQELLLTFLITKLKGNAYTKFALKLTQYKHVYEFLEAIEEAYALKWEDPLTFWTQHMMQLKPQEYESIVSFGTKFQELLQCAIFEIKYATNKEERCVIEDDDTEKQIAVLDEVATEYFLLNLNNNIRVKSHLLGHLSGRSIVKNFTEMINLAVSLEEQYARDIEEENTYFKDSKNIKKQSKLWQWLKK